MIKNNKRTRWWDALAGFFLLLALLTAASRLVATGWTRDLSVVQTLTFFGVVIGLALGYSRFSPFVAFLLAAAYGIIAIPWQLGSLLRDDLLWLERATILINRLGIILYQILHREVLRDSLLFLVIMSILYWVLSVQAGYWMVRYGHSWEAVLPAGICIFVIHAFDPLVFRRGLYLALFFAFALIFVSRMIYIQFRNRWETSHTALPPQLGWNFFRFTIVAVLLIVVFAWTIPGLANAAPVAQQAWKPVLRLWDRTRDQFESFFAPLRSTAAGVTTLYGESTALGRGNPLSDSQVFSVEVPGNIPPGIRLYWRARVYDFYEDGQWLSTLGNANAYDPQRTNIRTPIYNGRWLGSFEFTSASSISSLFTPALPLWVNQDGWVEYLETSDGTADISTFRPDPPLEVGQEYKSQSAVNYATEAQLRSAGTEYPEWVTNRFLQLPDTITPRMVELAKTLTENEPTVYDKTVAITNYLRKNYEYSDTIEGEIPSEGEVIDWFLFEHKKGFCNYYSTAQILLLRAAGIPARWAVGYAQGDQLEGDRTSGQASQENITFLVRQNDAHAWPEVFFPGIGWVEFEPTVSQPDIARIPGNNSEIEQGPLINQFDPLSRRDMEQDLADLLNERNLIQSETEIGPKQSYMVYLIGLAVAGIFGILFWFWRAGWLSFAWRGGMIYISWRKRRQLIILPLPIMLENTLRKIGIQPPEALKIMSRRALLTPISKAYLQINIALERLGVDPQPNETPSERAQLLGIIAPETERAAQRLVREYHLATFSRKPANMVIAWNAASEIRDITRKESYRMSRKK